MRLPKELKIAGVVVALAAGVPASAEVLSEIDGLDARDVVSDNELDGMRGGFVTSDGLSVLFGIQQAVFLEGRLQAVTPLLTFSSTGKAVPLSSLERFQTITTGDPDFVAAGFSAMSLPQSIIQNNLNGITIEAVTVINAAVSNGSLIRSMSISSTLTGQIIQSLR